MFWFIGREARGILAPWPGIEPATLMLEGKVLTTGMPGKFPEVNFWGITNNMEASQTNLMLNGRGQKQLSTHRVIPFMWSSRPG